MIQEKVFVLFALMAATLCVTQGKGNEACSDNIALSISACKSADKHGAMTSSLSV